MTAYTRNMKQDATYWAPGPNDGFGGQLMLSPILIKCRWQDQAVLFRDTSGREVTSSAVVYVDRDLTARELEFLNETIGADRLTTVRATPPLAYYTQTAGGLITFGPNLSRYGDRGLLVEPSRTNHIQGSLQVIPGSFNWQIYTGGVVTGNFAAAPDGSLTASRFVKDSQEGVFQTVTGLTQNTDYRYSTFLKEISGGGLVRLVALNSGFVNVTINTGEPYANGWYRHSLPSSTGVGEVAGQVFVTAQADLGIQDFLVWGVQLEPGTVATSIIPTTGAAVTRAADAIDIILPLGTTSIDYTFDDDSEQSVVAAAGLYTIPTDLDRPYIKAITVNYLDDAVQNRGYLALGDRTTIADPRSLPDAFEVRSLQKSPHLSGDPILHKALL